MLVPVRGFAPDVDPTEPGVLTACVGYIPSTKGMKAAPAKVSVGLAALASACRGSAVLLLLDRSRRLFAGTATNLYEAGSSTWTDVSRAVGTYTLGADATWRFAQYGNVSLAAQKGDKIQFSVSSGDFDNITAAPRASIVEVVGQHVFAFDINDGSDRPSGWKTSALGDYTDWTSAVATNAYDGNLVSTPGPIVAGRRLADGVVAYKHKAMYLGTFQGPPIGWAWQEVSDTAGALSHEVVVPITTQNGGQAHVFMGDDDFYFYDGSRPVRIGTPVKDWVFARLNREYNHKSTALHDPINALIYFFYVSNNSGDGSLDSAIVYNYRAERWGVDDRVIEAVAHFVSNGQTYGDFQTAYSTYANVPSGPYGLFVVDTTPVPAIFDATHTLYALSGTAGTCSFTTGDIGDGVQFTSLNRLRVRWITKPSSATLLNYYRNELGETLNPDMAVAMTNSHFDLLREARWHRGTVETIGDAEVTALQPEVEAGGLE
jgi:hypothetical protein